MSNQKQKDQNADVIETYSFAFVFSQSLDNIWKNRPKTNRDQKCIFFTTQETFIKYQMQLCARKYYEKYHRKNTNSVTEYCALSPEQIHPLQTKTPHPLIGALQHVLALDYTNKQRVQHALNTYCVAVTVSHIHAQFTPKIIINKHFPNSVIVVVNNETTYLISENIDNIFKKSNLSYDDLVESSHKCKNQIEDEYIYQLSIVCLDKMYSYAKLFYETSKNTTLDIGQCFIYILEQHLISIKQEIIQAIDNISVIDNVGYDEYIGNDYKQKVQTIIQRCSVIINIKS